MTRVFISIDIPKKVRKEVGKIQDQLPDFVGKRTESENLHLTLKFLGEIDEMQVEKVKERLKEVSFEKFEAEVDEIGVFSEKFVRIVWLHLSNCERLQKKVDSALSGLFEIEKRFMSHLTIARVKSIENKKLFLKKLKEIEISDLKFKVDEFRLKESLLKRERAEYKTLKEYRCLDY